MNGADAGTSRNGRSDVTVTTVGEPTSLSALDPGQTATITSILSRGSLRRRLVDLGLVTGARVTMERSAPLGDPVEILVKGTHLSLRREEAAAVQVTIES